VGLLHKKKFEVLKSTRRGNFNGVDTGKRFLKFGRKQSAFQLKDSGEARAIDQKYGRYGTNEVVVVPVDEHRDKTHPMLIVMPEKTWKTEKESEYEWVEIRPGRYRMVKKEKDK
jgi:hypothetical protein